MHETNEPSEATELSPHTQLPLISSASPIAPWWHTAVLIGLIALTSVLGSRHATRRSLATHHLANYALTIAWEWILAALAYLGLRLRRVPLRAILGERRAGLRGLIEDTAAAALFWVLSMIVLAIIAVSLRLLHFESAQKRIADLAPSTIADAVAWLALAITAGICEEFLFRGYFQRQFTSINGRAWLGIVASSMLFGAAHGYEGAAGMIAITAYGALFSILALKRNSLRAGMIAHAWHDTFTGIALAILKHAKVPI